MRFLLLALLVGGGSDGRVLHQREAALHDRVQAIGQVASWHGEYRAIRDFYLLGPHGLVTALQSQIDLSVQLVGEMQALIELVRSARGGLSENEIRVAVRDKLQQLQEENLELRRLAELAGQRAQFAHGRLALLGSLTPEIVPAYSEVTSLLRDRGEELNAAISALQQDANAAYRGAWETNVSSLARGFAAATLAESVVDAGPECAVRIATEELAADSILYPHVLEVRSALSSLQECILSRRYFAARDALAAFEVTCDNSASSILSSGLDPMYSREALAETERLRSTGRGAWRVFNTVGAPWQLLGSHLAQQSKILAADCRDPVRRMQRNCGLLRQFLGISSETLKNMNEAELALVENSIDRVRRGPLS